MCLRARDHRVVQGLRHRRRKPRWGVDCLASLAFGLALLAALTPALAQAAPGDLDPSFGTGGKVTTDFGGDVGGEILSVAIDRQGRIVAGGFSAGSRGPGYFTLVRYRSDGSLDPSFGTGGIAVTDLEGTAFSVAIDRVGRIVAAGSAIQSASASSDFAVARYHSDGTPDRSFGSGGKVTTDFGGLEYARSVAIDSRGRIVAAGQRGLERGWFVLARYTPSGNLDPSFSGDGKAITGFRGIGVRARATSAVIDSQNRIFAAGYVDTGAGDDDFALVRYSANGVISSRSFGTGGKVTTNFGGDEDAESVAIDSQERIVAAGRTNGGFALARYYADGSLDRAFGDDGRVSTDFAYGSAYDVAVDSQGRIVAVGGQPTGGEYDNRSAFAVARYNPNGSLDSSFGAGGKVTTDFGAETLDEAFSVAIDSQDRIVAAGYRSGVYALARYLG
jgi:uncharacterized delta-60 repeat protein